MKFEHMQRQGGFSLIEVLVYIAVLVLVSTAVVTTYLSLHTVLVRNEMERELTKAAHGVLERFVRDVRAATAINTLERTLSDELALDQSISTTTEYYVASGRMYVDVNDVAEGPLTPEAVVVDSVVFTAYDHVGGDIESEAVRIALTLSINAKEASTTRTFYTSAVLRGTYE